MTNLMRIQQKTRIKTQGFYSESEPEYLANPRVQSENSNNSI